MGEIEIMAGDIEGIEAMAAGGARDYYTGSLKSPSSLALCASSGAPCVDISIHIPFKFLQTGENYSVDWPALARASSRRRCTSRIGGTPKRLLYSRLKWEAS